MDSVINSLPTVNVTPIVKPKNTFVEALEKLDLQGCLLMMTVLSERALYLQSKAVMDKPVIMKRSIL